MKEKVNIFIEGIIQDEEESNITTSAVGEYSLLDGRHIIKYKEAASENEEESHNTIRISPGLVEMVKRGENNTHMVFNMSQTTHSIYETPYGSLKFQINTRKIDIEDKPSEIIIHLEYSLSHNKSHISDNRIRIAIKEI